MKQQWRFVAITVVTAFGLLAPANAHAQVNGCCTFPTGCGQVTQTVCTANGGTNWDASLVCVGTGAGAHCGQPHPNVPLPMWATLATLFGLVSVGVVAITRSRNCVRAD
jgi:hypothetical protein